MARSISFSRPMTGSSLPWRASSVRSRPKLSRAGVLLFPAFAEVSPPPPVAPQVGALRASRLLRRIGRVDPTSLYAYRQHGGYTALTRAFEMGAAQVIAEVTASRLMWRGGAAFPTGRKWESVARETVTPPMPNITTGPNVSSRFKPITVSAPPPGSAPGSV